MMPANDAVFCFIAHPFNSDILANVYFDPELFLIKRRKANAMCNWLI